MAASQPDALDALRSALAGFSDDPAAALRDGGSIKLLDASGSIVAEADVTKAASVQLGESVFSSTQTTRLARSRVAGALAADSRQTPANSAESFFALDAILFAVQLAKEQGGQYVVQATAKGLPRIDAVERPDILAYLIGKRAEWEGVLSLQEVRLREGTAQELEQTTTPPSSPPLALKQLYAATTTATSSKRAYVPSKADAAFVKRLRTAGVEIVLQNRNHAMRGTYPWTKTADFTSFRVALSPTIELARKIASGAATASSSRPAPAAAQSSASASAPARRQRAQEPIIMLSNSPTALINMFNVKKLLEEGVFVDPVEARTAAGGVTEPIVAVSHRYANAAPAAAGTTARASRFLVLDNAETLQKLAGGSAGGGAGGSGAWGRVVVVFTTGQTWQFKNYQWSEPRELFKHVMGVYVRWQNEPKHANVRDWPITEMMIDRTRRHTDRQAVSHFWRNVEGFVTRRKPHLVYQ